MLVSSIRTAPPSVRLVTVAEVRAQARIDSNFEDDLITQIILAAEAAIESKTRRSFSPQTWTSFYSNVLVGSPETLPRPPVTSCVISYRASGGGWTVASTFLNLESEPAFWYPPANVSLYRPDDGSPTWKAVSTCGVTANVPAPVKQAVLMLCQHLFDNRSLITIGSQAFEIPLTVELLIEPYIVPTAF